MGLMGPMYARLESDGMATVGLYVLPQHMNSQEAVHGGMIASLADNTMGYHARAALDNPVATVNLGVDYLGRICLGDWLQVRTEVDRRGKRLVFMRCSGWVNNEQVFRAHGVFSAIRRSQ